MAVEMFRVLRSIQSNSCSTSFSTSFLRSFSFYCTGSASVSQARAFSADNTIWSRPTCRFASSQRESNNAISIAQKRIEVKRKKLAKTRSKTLKEKGGRCKAYCTAQTYDLQRLLKMLEPPHFKISIRGKVVHVQYYHNITNGNLRSPPGYIPMSRPELARFPSMLGDSVESDPCPPKDVFFFEDGAFVCWGMSESEEQIWLKFVEILQTTPVETISEYLIVFQDSEAGVVEDCAVLGQDNEHIAEQQLAFSYSLVRSVKLDVSERGMERMLYTMRDVPRNLKQGILPTSHECQKVIGEQLELRGSVNLYSELSATPEYYWEAPPQFEKLFEAMEENLDIENRVTLLNERLSHAQEITDIARSYLHHRETRWSEIAIILLIAVEIVLTLLKKFEWWDSWTWESLFGFRKVKPLPHAAQLNA